MAVFPVSELKSEQNLENIVGRRDVFGQLPTGFGKSLIFSTAAMTKAYQFFLDDFFFHDVYSMTSVANSTRKTIVW